MAHHLSLSPRKSSRRVKQRSNVTESNKESILMLIWHFLLPAEPTHWNRRTPEGGDRDDKTMMNDDHVCRWLNESVFVLIEELSINWGIRQTDGRRVSCSESTVVLIGNQSTYIYVSLRVGRWECLVCLCSKTVMGCHQECLYTEWIPELHWHS